MFLFHRPFAAPSPVTSRLRFHAPLKEVPQRLLREFTKPDQREHVGFVAEEDGRAADGATLLAAEARYVRCLDSDAAEFALVVADSWRRVGLGSSLMQTLLRHARLAGVQRLCGDARVDNDAIGRFMYSLGAYPSGKIDSTVRLCLSTRQDRLVGAMGTGPYEPERKAGDSISERHGAGDSRQPIITCCSRSVRRIAAADSPNPGRIRVDE